MITVKHVLKDGTTITDLTGHIVRKSDAAGVYKIADKINERYMKRKDCEQWQRMSK